MGSQALAMAARFDEAAERNEQAICLAREHGLSENLGWALGASAMNALWAGKVLTGGPIHAPRPSRSWCDVERRGFRFLARRPQPHLHGLIENVQHAVKALYS